jgi:hypothetical protein
MEIQAPFQKSYMWLKKKPLGATPGGFFIQEFASGEQFSRRSIQLGAVASRV